MDTVITTNPEVQFEIDGYTGDNCCHSCANFITSDKSEQEDEEFGYFWYSKGCCQVNTYQTVNYDNLCDSYLAI